MNIWEDGSYIVDHKVAEESIEELNKIATDKKHNTCDENKVFRSTVNIRAYINHVHSERDFYKKKYEELKNDMSTLNRIINKFE